MKRGWKESAGFTLVELVVVMAILGILGGVAVPAYSGYVKKANMSADQTLAADIANAMLLQYYADPAGAESGSVVLKHNGEPDADEAFGQKVLEAVYGTGWKSLRLKYEGWKNSSQSSKTEISESNFSDGAGGVNMELLKSVDNLTGQMSEVMSILDEDGFPGYNDFLRENGIDPEADSQHAANASVLYLAQTSNKAAQEQMKQKLLLADTWTDGTGINLEDFFADITDNGTCTQFEAVALVYATMQGYCLSMDVDPNAEGSYSKRFYDMDLLAHVDPIRPDEGQILEAMQEGFTEMLTDPVFEDFDPETFYDYLENGAKDDIEAYYGVIDGIYENQDYLRKNLNGSKNFYANQKNFLASYWGAEIAPGQVGVVFAVTDDGQPKVSITGMGE